jgi:galactokinase/mevalonate kinase-like predicted kinase
VAPGAPHRAAQVGTWGSRSRSDDQVRARSDGIHEGRDVGGIVLTVGIERHDDRVPVAQAVHDSRLECGAVAEMEREIEDPATERTGDLGRIVAGTVVDDEERVGGTNPPQLAQNRFQILGLIPGGYGHEHSLCHEGRVLLWLSRRWARRSRGADTNRFSGPCALVNGWIIAFAGEAARPGQDPDPGISSAGAAAAHGRSRHSERATSVPRRAKNLGAHLVGARLTLLATALVRLRLARVTELNDTIINRVVEALEWPSEDPLGPDALGTLLKHVAVDRVTRSLGGLDALRQELRRGDEGRRSAVLAEIGEALGEWDAASLTVITRHPRVAVGPGLIATLFDPDHEDQRRTFLTRVGQMAFEEILSARAAPEPRLRILDPLGADERAKLLPGAVTHAVVVGELIGAVGEIFPLMLDAYACDLRVHGHAFVNVVGVHASWLSEAGGARRALFYDHAGERLIETELEEPLVFESCQFLYLGRSEESGLHRELSARLSGHPQVNPHAAAGRCEDKQRTFELLRAAGLETPRTALIRRGDGVTEIARALQDAGLTGRRRIVVQPNHGTEGAGVVLGTVDTDDAESVSGLAGLATRVQATETDDVVVREFVAGLRYRAGKQDCAADLRVNVAWTGCSYRAESAYLQVARSADDELSSVGRGGRIVALSEGAFEALGLSSDDVQKVGEIACAAAAAVATDLGETERLWLVGVDLRLVRREGRVGAWILDVNPRPAGLSYAELIETREPGVCPGLFGPLAGLAAASAVIEIVRIDQDADHRPLVRGAAAAGALSPLLQELEAFLRLDAVSSGESRIDLLQERAILVLADALWEGRRTGSVPTAGQLDRLLEAASSRDETRRAMRQAVAGDELSGSDEDYLAFVNQFLAAVNEREMRDFARSKENLLSRMPSRRSVDLRLADKGVVYEAEVPMRVGISSANASDNWTFSKLRGGMVVNFAVDLSIGEGEAPRPPITVTLEAIERPALELSTVSRMETDRPTEIAIDESNARAFFACADGDALSAAAGFRDIGDPLLLLKYALAFTGIVGWREAPEAYAQSPRQAIVDVLRFTGGRGLRLSVKSDGPSRSGFASSSCVALGLLSVLYRASGQCELLEAETLSSLALLLENEVGLKSGKQDTDGPLYPGVKALRYRPTDGFLRSEIAQLAIDEAALQEHLLLVNSGVQRPPAVGLRRGLNMRHLTYLSRDPERFPAIVRSLEVHEEIVAALGAEDWPRLGTLFTEYLGLRETIDSGATTSVHDAAAGEKVLRLPFTRLIAQGLIHGGMYTGAMGGGCMMLVVTPRGRETVEAGRGRRKRVELALNDLRDLLAGEAQPFRNLEVYHYAVNARGLRHIERRSAGGSAS